MSIEVIKAGIADTIHDEGRFGYQHLGINPSGAMDLNAMKIANALVGNELSEPAVELNFPASSFRFHKSTIAALSGADFSAKLNGERIPINRPFLVPVESELAFSKVISGSRCYLALQGGFSADLWLGSFSTNTKAKAGGVKGRSLKKMDIIKFKRTLAKIEQAKVLPWSASLSEFYPHGKINCIRGHEYDWLTKKSQSDFQKGRFLLSTKSDRMGYRLKGTLLKQSKKREMLSTAITFGTVQLLPDGQLIVLMADHQTTGGYPRIAHVVSTHRSSLAQLNPDDKVSFQFITLDEAEQLAVNHKQSLRQLKASCTHKLKDVISEIGYEH